MRCYAFVLASMYRYSWLITFEIFRIFFGIEGWVGGVHRIQTFLDFYICFIFTRPLMRVNINSDFVTLSRAHAVLKQSLIGQIHPPIVDDVSIRFHCEFSLKCNLYSQKIIRSI